MARSGPNPLALFSLVPANELAQVALGYHENAHLVSSSANDDKKNVSGIDIGFHISTKSRYTIATIGRCGDVVVGGSGISRLQCSFEMHDGNEMEVMLQDRSSNQTTRFHGVTAKSFESGRQHRRVVVDRKTNLRLGFGGVACDRYMFDIVWHNHFRLDIPKCLQHREDNPRQARTLLEEALTVVPSARATRIHTSYANTRFRYSKRRLLGMGSYGDVWKAVDVDSGDLVAVKLVKRPPLQSHAYKALKQEVETLDRVHHCKASQWEGEFLAIIMDLKPGNVEDLVGQKVFINDESLTKPLLHQTLQALDYLAHNGIIHRDVKPANILFEPASKGGYEYQLADFGFASLAADAQSIVGTLDYMAPEFFDGRQNQQTPKMDVWSLFVTLAYATDMAGYQRKPLHTIDLRITAAREAASTDLFRPLQSMAIVDPSQRASAADMLDKVWGGKGRTSPRHPENTDAYKSRGEPNGRQNEGRGARQKGADHQERRPQEGPMTRHRTKLAVYAAMQNNSPHPAGTSPPEQES